MDVIDPQIIEVFRLFLCGIMTDETGVAWKVESDADPWNILFIFDCFCNDKRYAPVTTSTKQIKHGMGFDELRKAAKELISHSASRAINL